MKYHTPNIPTLDMALKGCSVHVVLPSKWKEFTFPQELQEGPRTSSDPSSISQGDHEPHLIQQSELNYLVHDLSFPSSQQKY
jgi:hypothetical protein